MTLAAIKELVKKDEWAWNRRDVIKIALSCTHDTEWNIDGKQFLGRLEVINFLTTKWLKQFDYKLKKELLSCINNRISLEFEYEYRNEEMEWCKEAGLEQWTLNEAGLISKREIVTKASSSKAFNTSML